MTIGVGLGKCHWVRVLIIFINLRKKTNEKLLSMNEFYFNYKKKILHKSD